MALIKAKESGKRVAKRVSLPESISAEMEAYCDWAGVSEKDFLEQAVEYVLGADSDWKKHKKAAAKGQPADKKDAGGQADSGSQGGTLGLSESA
ncbi:MAG TPA: hypothetical protein VK979_05375 [Guyparkeria sp.]|nr:hypothetical protein [Guyparkeria sp.]